MKRLEHDLLTGNYTEVFHDEPEYNAPHVFVVTEKESKGKNELTTVTFQKGAIKEVGVNGIANEDLISMVICRLDHFQESEFASYDNDMAIIKLEEALLWLRKRTMGREKRGVEGTSVK